MAEDSQQASAESPPPDVRQARQIVAEYDCRMYGHSWDVIERFGGPPVRITCSRCGQGYAVNGGAE